MVKRKRKSNPENNNSKTNDEVESEGQFWAEAILDWGLHDNGTMMYFIKWEGFPDSQNSWEFQQHISHCSDLLIAFHTTEINARYPPKWSFEEFDTLCKYMRELIQSHDLPVFKRFFKQKINSFEIKDKIQEIKSDLRIQLNKIRDKLDKIKNRTNSNRLEVIKVIKKVTTDLNINENFGSISHFFDFVDRRRVVTQELMVWEKQINEVIKRESEGKPIKVVNDIDFEKPKLYEYITKYIIDTQFSCDLKLEEETPLVGCKCDNCYECRDECCTSVIGFPMVYDSEGVLDSNHFNTIIYECNSKCLCDQNCPNRQIQRGRQFQLEIFRTESETRGWGVRAIQHIPKGSFITQYTGEIISVIEADKRPSTYLFDLSAHLNSKDNEFTYVVDASKYGNVTRFINHSCAPNCRVLFAWINQSSNQLLPIIALFAENDIKVNEELTYDYSMELIDFYNHKTGHTYKGLVNQNYDSEALPIWTSSGVTNNGFNVKDKNNESQTRRRALERINCECGADSCRNFLYS